MNEKKKTIILAVLLAASLALLWLLNSSFARVL